MKLKITRSKLGHIDVSSFLTLSALSLSASAMAILSRLHIVQFSVFLGTKQLIINNICHLILENSMLLDVVNLVKAFDCNFLIMLCLFCCHLFLNEFPVEPMYSLSLTFALYIPFKRHSLLNGQFVLFLQLQVLVVFFCF